MRDSTITFGYIGITYSGMVPAGDMADRFGWSNQIGGEAGVKFSNNWYLNGGMKFLFGIDVREKVAQNVTTEVGSEDGGFSTMAIGADGRFYETRFWERGFIIPVTVGKIFSLSPRNPNSGIYVEFGGQFIQHKILIDVVGNNVPSLDKRHRKGYDRLSNGFGLTEGVGYKFHGKSRTLNFLLGLEFSQSFTRNRRTVNMDTGQTDHPMRNDLFFGFRAAWIFPVYKAAPDTYYYY